MFPEATKGGKYVAFLFRFTGVLRGPLREATGSLPTEFSLRPRHVTSGPMSFDEADLGAQTSVSGVGLPGRDSGWTGPGRPPLDPARAPARRLSRAAVRCLLLRLLPRHGLIGPSDLGEAVGRFRIVKREGRTSAVAEPPQPEDPFLLDASRRKRSTRDALRERLVTLCTTRLALTVC